jgi:hypothetical protein
MEELKNNSFKYQFKIFKIGKYLSILIYKIELLILFSRFVFRDFSRKTMTFYFLTNYRISSGFIFFFFDPIARKIAQPIVSLHVEVDRWKFTGNHNIKLFQIASL